MTSAFRDRLPAVLTQREAPQVLDAMAAGTASARTDGTADVWRVDASALTDFDSSALAVLLARKRLAAAAGCRFAIVDPPRKLVRLAALYGLDEVLLGEAIAAGEAAGAA